MIRLALAVLVATTLTATSATAQTNTNTTQASPPAQEQAKSQQDIILLTNELESGAFSFESGVPATPALTIIGASGDAIPTTSNLQSFAISVLRASETAGGGTAAGLDFSPYWGMRRTMSLANYTEDGQEWRRRLLRGRVSAAFTEGDEAKNAPSRASIGFATSLLDSSDPSMIEASSNVPLYSACILNRLETNAALEQAFDSWEDADHDADVIARIGGTQEQIEAANLRRDAAFTRLNAAYAQPARDCRDITVNAARRGRAWDVGAAFQWTGEPGSLDSMEPAGSTVWMTLTSGRELEFVPLSSEGASSEANFRAVGHVRFDFESIGRTASNLEVEYDRQTAALAIERLGPNSVFSLQASYRNSDGATGTEFDGESWQYLLRADFRARDWIGDTLGDNVWISVAVGAIDGDSIEEDTYTSVALRFKRPDRGPVINAPWGTR